MTDTPKETRSFEDVYVIQTNRIGELERELAETKRLLAEAQHWHNEALRIGEKFADVGPKGYYSFTSEEWFRWALPAIEEKMRLLVEAREEGRQAGLREAAEMVEMTDLSKVADPSWKLFFADMFIQIAANIRAAEEK
jgi:hypothetical protein